MEVNEYSHKIIKVQKYNIQLNDINNKLNVKTCALFATAVVSLCLFKIADARVFHDTVYYVNNVLGGAGSVASIGLIKSIVSSILERSVIIDNKEALIYELENDKIENEDYARGR